LVMADSEPFGYVCVADLNAGNTAWVTDLVVAPEKRRRGFGLLLLNEAQEWARQRRFMMFVFEVQAKNHPAIRMAQKGGLEFGGYNDRYYANQDVTLFFGCTLR